METLVESPRVVFVSGSSLPASSPFSIYRLILPFLCISIGVSVGTATGLTLALVNASNHAVAASSESAVASAAPESNLAANANSAQATEMAITSSPIAATGASANTDANPTPDAQQAKLTPAALSTAPSASAPAKVELVLNKTPDALKPATFRLEGKTYHVARMMFLPHAAPDEKEPIAAQPVAPTALNSAQWSLDTPAAATLYTEGVLTVSDYSASSGTIQTSDGRTFALGTTVAAGNATSWETYRSDVHFRCDQNGSCVLMRAGVVAPDAKLI